MTIDMQCVILAGGFGTRLSEYTDTIPKPMVSIGEKPILVHIMEKYAQHGITNFIIALGYKAEVIKHYFANVLPLQQDFTVNIGCHEIAFVGELNRPDWNITLVNTGLETATAGRLLKLQKFLDKDDFCLTYGDGLSDVDISSLIRFHKNQKKAATVTAVRPPAKFGELTIVGNNVTKFDEKPQLEQGWINGGFFVFSPRFLKYVRNENDMLERGPLSEAAAAGELGAFKHSGFWQCMDSKNDKDRLEKLWKEGAPWKSN